MPLLAPLRLRALAGASAHRVTWLELFFDLIFVAAVAQVADPLHEDYTLAGVGRFAVLFALIWWAWTGHAVFATRFDADDAAHRIVMVIQVFVVAAMAANARDTLDSVSTAGFAAAYAVLRGLLIAQYTRARHVHGARRLTSRLALGHGLAALLWLTAALVPVPARYALWGAACALDFGTPWATLTSHADVPPGAAHLSERVGLFTLILLGEAVVAVMRGMESQDSWPATAALSALLSMAILFGIWWWYFEGTDALAAQHVRSRREAIRHQIWSYAHYPLYLGVVVLGVGLQRVVSHAAHVPLAWSDWGLMALACSGVGGGMLAIASAVPTAAPTAASGAGDVRRAVPASHPG